MDSLYSVDIWHQFTNTLSDRNIDERPEHVHTYLRALGVILWVILWPLMAIVLFFTAHSEQFELPAGSLFLPQIHPRAPRWSHVPRSICNTAEPWGKGPGPLPLAAAPAGFSPGLQSMRIFKEPASTRRIMLLRPEAPHWTWPGVTS